MKPRKWTAEEEQFLRDHAHEMTAAEMAEHLDRTDQSVKGYMQRKGIKTGRTGQFKKGHKTWNKGKKGLFMSPNCKKSWFKKGHKPENTLFDGAVTIRHERTKYGKVIPYMWIRLEEANWEPYHRYLWKKHNGPIPSDHVVIFKDGNTMNCCIENLNMISMRENALRNRDWEKAMQTMERNGTHASINLTDNFVATMMAGHDPQIKEYLLTHRPDLIRLARANYKLKREIKHASTEYK